jgi:hypothetical protein
MDSQTIVPVEVKEERQYDWPLCYDAENLVEARIKSFLSHNSFAGALSERMRSETGTLLIDWTDHLVLPPEDEQVFLNAGFTIDNSAGTPPAGKKYFWHPQALLPRIIVDKKYTDHRTPVKLAIRVDHLSDFIAVHGIDTEPEGDPFTRLRNIVASIEKDTQFEVVERCGYRGYEIEKLKPGYTDAFLEAQTLWKTRKRNFSNDAVGLDQTHETLDRMIDLVGQNTACHIIFSEERSYWEQKNQAAQFQKRRQDLLGLGWANHDHHTFRCSRGNFIKIMQIFEKLGFQRRERYYAGAEAGWGAQIMEQPIEGIVAFCDVDLEPDETDIDFSRQTLPPSKNLGTIGLWVGLHGESFLEAGMHHLECSFDYTLMRAHFLTNGISVMDPFSDFSFLKQAFTQGERWPVQYERVEKLLHENLIDKKQFDRFIAEGAIGSHLEHLQRRGGFKGFNQKSVSVIIHGTDPRNQLHWA